MLKLFEKTDLTIMDDWSCFGFFRVRIEQSTNTGKLQQCRQCLSVPLFTPMLPVSLSGGKTIVLQRYISVPTDDESNTVFELRIIKAHATGTLLYDTDCEKILTSNHCDLDIEEIVRTVRQNLRLDKDTQVGLLMINGGAPNSLRTTSNCIVVPVCDNDAFVKTNQALFLEIVSV